MGLARLIIKLPGVIFVDPEKDRLVWPLVAAFR